MLENTRLIHSNSSSSFSRSGSSSNIRASVNFTNENNAYAQFNNAIRAKLSRYIGDEDFKKDFSDCEYRMVSGNFIIYCKTQESCDKIKSEYISSIKEFCLNSWSQYGVNAIVRCGTPSDSVGIIAGQTGYAGKRNVTFRDESKSRSSSAKDMKSDAFIAQNEIAAQNHEANVFGSGTNSAANRCKQSFANFISDSSNDVALRACQHFAGYDAGEGEGENAGYHLPESGQLICITGDVGHGKTHLSQAVRLTLGQNNKKVAFFAAEVFLSSYVSALRKKTICEFKETLMSADVFIIDDLHALIGKKKTIDELTNIICCALDAGKNVMLTSAVSEMGEFNLNKRLMSRISSGMVAKISKPSESLKCKVASQMIMNKNLPIGVDVIKFLAQNVSGGVREMKGAINRLAIASSLYQTTFGIGIVKEMLRDILRTDVASASKTAINSNYIAHLVEGFFDLNEGEISSSSRNRSVSWARNIAMYLCKVVLKDTYSDIGKKMGDRTHVAVVHAITKVTDALNAGDEKTIKAIEFARNQIALNINSDL